MRYKPTKRQPTKWQPTKYTETGKWYGWWAWYPVKTTYDEWVWCENVARRQWHSWGGGGWEYA